MDREPNGVLSWDIEQIAKALKIKPEDVREYFTDGRRVSFIVERRIAREVLKGKLAPTEGAGYDVIDSHGGKWEIRSITRGGIYFCPSYMVGSGRHFEEKGFLRKLEEIKGFIIADIESFPDIPFWIIPVEQVKEWWFSGKLGKFTKISRKKALELLQEDKI
ncbi:MAG TPA: hypothetical protein ENG11_00110 [candidate division Zixibacteria bacterium]|nr:hypothetical protein [candidate division Zixibacteria bacterium]